MNTKIYILIYAVQVSNRKLGPAPDAMMYATYLTNNPYQFKDTDTTMYIYLGLLTFFLLLHAT